jgi:hypothetical protein
LRREAPTRADAPGLDSGARGHHGIPRRRDRDRPDGLDDLQHIATDPIGALGGAIGRAVEGYGAMFSGSVGDPGSMVAAIQTATPATSAAPFGRSPKR